MEVSNITLSPSLKHQECLETKILRWMQEHPRSMRETNNARLARTMRIPNTNIESVRTRINLMVNKQIIFRQGGKKRANYEINYLHKDIPPAILESAPLEVKLNVKRQLGKMDEVGAFIRKQSTPAEQGTPTQKEEHANPQDIAPASTESNPTIGTPEVKLDATSEGLKLTININLTIKQ